MSRRKGKRPRRASLKLNLESLESRWLLSAGDRRPEVDHAGLLIRDTPQRPRAESVAMVAARQAQRLDRGVFGPWGGLRLLVAMEARGDHWFDALYGQLSDKFARWAAHHPFQARSSGIDPPPLSTAGAVAGNPAVPVAAGAVLSSPRAGGVPVATPEAGPPPPIKPLLDVGTAYILCPLCPTTANDVSPGTNGAGLGPMAQGSPAPRFGSSDASSAAPADPQPSLMPLGSPGPMESDAVLVTGEYLQSHQLAAYQALGQDVGLALQYSSLQANPMPVVTESLTTQTGTDSAHVSSITVSLTVDGISQGDAGTHDDIALTDGSTYLVQYQATDVSSLATGMYDATLTVTKHFSDATLPVTETYDDTVMLVNLASSHYGAGWSIAGLQHFTGTTA